MDEYDMSEVDWDELQSPSDLALELAALLLCRYYMRRIAPTVADDIVTVKYHHPNIFFYARDDDVEECNRLPAAAAMTEAMEEFRVVQRIKSPLLES